MRAHPNKRNGRQSDKRAAISPQVSPASDEGFTADQIERLNQALDLSCVHVRDADGCKLSYIEGWYAVAQANEVFDFSGWDREMIHFERVNEQARGGMYKGYCNGHLKGWRECSGCDKRLVEYLGEDAVLLSVVGMCA